MSLRAGPVDQEKSDLSELQRALGVAFREPSLLRQALTHASYVNENPDWEWGDNERLEFLGDAVANLVAAECLFRQFPAGGEGELTRLRAELVRTVTLAGFARQTGLAHYLRMGRGERQAGGQARSAMLGNAFEAVLGAIYLDQGLEAARQFFAPLVQSSVDALAQGELRDAKTLLQEWSQARLHDTPSYATVEERGPDHAKLFTIEVRVDGRLCGRGTGRSKQEAEQAAAELALRRLTGQPSVENHCAT